MDICRRNFLGGLAGLAVAGTLRPVAAAERTASFTDELIDNYLKLTKLKLDVGAKTPFKVLHASDTHLSMDDAGDLLKGDAAVLRLYEARQPRFSKCVQSLAATIAYAKREKIPLLHTGDLIDHFSEANLACVGNSVAGLDWFAAFGNHEAYGHHTALLSPKTASGAEAMRKRFEAVWPNPVMVASRMINGVNFVAFNNGGLERWWGKEVVEGLEAALSKDAPAVLLCHIPFCATDIYEDELRHNRERKGKPDWDFGRNLGAYLKFDEPVGEAKPTSHMKAVGRIVRAHAKTNLKAILCGHIHHEFQGTFAGIPQIVAGGNFEGRAYELELA